MYKIGIIPAAGKASRFGGIPKELLPLTDGRSLLEHAIERVSFCDEIVVVTSPEKCALHMRLLGDDIRLVLQKGDGLWGAIQTGMNTVDGEQYFMTMPDTYVDVKCFHGVPPIDFAYGYFLTRTPERFGVLKDGGFVDKADDVRIPAVAWGALMWSRSVRALWNLHQPQDYTEAINMALWQKRYGCWAVGSYFDCANIESYFGLLDHLRKYA